MQQSSTLVNIAMQKNSSINAVGATNTKAAKLFVSANAATDIWNSVNPDCTLSGSSYILSDATRGNGVQTYNMKKGTNYSTAVNFTDS
jgi:hypothetical protein